MGAFLLLNGPITAANLSERLVDDARDGRLDDFDFIAAALIAGGVEDECELSGWLDWHAQRRALLLDSLPDGTTGERLRAIHGALHGQILTGEYQTAASDLRFSA